jgi:SAM-dependent methyltransferase
VSRASGRVSGCRVVPSQGGNAPSRALISVVKREILETNSRGSAPLLLNLGAGRSTGIETQLAQAGARFSVDRIDLELTIVRHANVREQWAGNIENLSTIANDSYDVAFCNYVLEHVRNVKRAVAEMARVLRPGALLVLTVPNPGAPEFRVAGRSPGWLHRVFQPHGFHTEYAYRSVAELVHYLDTAGMRVEICEYCPVVGAYLTRVSGLLGRLGDAYDGVVVRLQARCLSGALMLAARKV